MDECLGSQNKSRNDTDKKWQHAAKRIHCPKTHCEWRPSHFLSYQLQKKKKKDKLTFFIRNTSENAMKMDELCYLTRKFYHKFQYHFRWLVHFKHVINYV